MSIVQYHFTPEFPSATSSDQILAGLSWRVELTGGRIVSAHTHETGQVIAQVDIADVDSLASLLSAWRIPALSKTVGPVLLGAGDASAPVYERDALDYVI